MTGTNKRVVGSYMDDTSDLGVSTSNFKQATPLPQAAR